MNTQMITRKNVVVPDVVAAAQFVEEQNIDVVDGTTHLDFTKLPWVVDVAENSIMLFVPTNCIDEDADFNLGFCMGTITEVKKCVSEKKGKKTSNLSVSLFYPMYMSCFSKSKKR
jgi:hypothetical protein